MIDVSKTQTLQNRSAFIYKLAFKFLQDSEEAADVMQEVLYKVWFGSPQYRELLFNEKWLRKVVRNKCVDLIRTAMRRQKLLADYCYCEEFRTRYQTEEPLHDRDYYKMLNKGSKLQQIIIHMHIKEGYNYNEIARKMGVSRQNISRRVQLYMKARRSELQKNAEIEIAKGKEEISI